MIVVDTNVVSEFMGTPPAPAVREWLNEQESSTLFFTTISIAEIYFGLRAMPSGQRQRLLEEQFEHFVAVAFESRMLSFDEQAARAFGEMRAHRRSLGLPMSPLDAQIAAIARSRRFVIATRNTTDFEHCEVPLINPFERAG